MIENDILYNQAALAILEDTRKRMLALGLHCRLGKSYVFEDSPISLALHISTSEEAVDQCIVAEHFGSEYANTPEGRKSFNVSYSEFMRDSKVCKASEWVLAQANTKGVDLKNDGYNWTLIVDDAVDKFNVDIEQLDSTLCAALSLTTPPKSPLRSDGFEATGLTIITDSANTTDGSQNKIRKRFILDPLEKNELFNPVATFFSEPDIVLKLLQDVTKKVLSDEQYTLAKQVGLYASSRVTTPNILTLVNAWRTFPTLTDFAQAVSNATLGRGNGT